MVDDGIAGALLLLLPCWWSEPTEEDGKGAVGARFIIDGGPPNWLAPGESCRDRVWEGG